MSAETIDERPLCASAISSPVPFVPPSATYHTCLIVLVPVATPPRFKSHLSYKYADLLCETMCILNILKSPHHRLHSVCALENKLRIPLDVGTAAMTQIDNVFHSVMASRVPFDCRYHYCLQLFIKCI